MSGSFVFFLGHFQYRLLYAVLKGVPLRAGTAWGLHFIITTVWSHWLHRVFTFRHHPQVPYLESLLRTFGSYAAVLAVSTAMMFFLCDVKGLSPVIGWILGTGLCAVCNFLIMSCWTICRSTGNNTGPDNFSLRIPHEVYSDHSDCSHQK